MNNPFEDYLARFNRVSDRIVNKTIVKIERKQIGTMILMFHDGSEIFLSPGDDKGLVCGYYDAERKFERLEI